MNTLTIKSFNDMVPANIRPEDFEQEGTFLSVSCHEILFYTVSIESSPRLIKNHDISGIFSTYSKISNV